jgi:hypothetical protein
MKTVVAAAASAAAVLAVAAIAQVDEEDAAAAAADADPATVAGDKGAKTGGFPRAAAFSDEERAGVRGSVDVDLDVDARPSSTAAARARAAERTEPGAREEPEAAPESDPAAATTVEAGTLDVLEALEAQRQALEAIADRLEGLAADAPVSVDDDVTPVEGDAALDEVEADVADEQVGTTDEPPPPPLSPAAYTLRSDPHQSKDPVEVQATEVTRAAIAADGDLSSQARAVYITTNGGLVELRGEVPSERERSLVEDRVRALVGDRFDVSNLLTVRDRD